MATRQPTASPPETPPFHPLCHLDGMKYPPGAVEDEMPYCFWNGPYAQRSQYVIYHSQHLQTTIHIEPKHHGAKGAVKCPERKAPLGPQNLPPIFRMNLRRIKCFRHLPKVVDRVCVSCKEVVSVLV